MTSNLESSKRNLAQTNTILDRLKGLSNQFTNYVKDKSDELVQNTGEKVAKIGTNTGIRPAGSTRQPQKTQSRVRTEVEVEEPVGIISGISSFGKNLSDTARKGINEALVGEIVPVPDEGINFGMYLRIAIALLIVLFLLYLYLESILEYFGIYVRQKKQMDKKLEKKNQKVKKREVDKKEREETKKLADEYLGKSTLSQEETTIEKALKEEKQKSDLQMAPNLDDATSSIQLSKNSSKSGYCYIGEDRGFRSCLAVSNGNECISGDIFPTEKLCINPNLRS